MNHFIRNLMAQFREFFRNLPPVKRVSAIASIVVVVVAAGIVVMMLSKTNYSKLLTNVPADQLPLIVDKLQKKNVPFALEDNGATVMVPTELLHATQMSIMADLGNADMGQIGLELFDRQDFGTTSYAQRINYQRALQGELIRSINSLSAVKQTKVILALPPKKTFLEEEGKASASVIVELFPGKALNPDQVRGITQLVASAVENMQAENVTVVDSRGKVLTRHLSSGMSASSDLMEIQQKVEQQLEERIEGILTKVVGAGKVIARVNASLDAKQTDVFEESVNPDGTAVQSQVTETEALDGSRSNPTGVPGARANLPGAEDNGTVGFRQNVNKELKTTNYSVPKTTRQIKQNAGGVEKITVAVVVDGITTFNRNEDGTESETWQPRSPEDLKKYEDIVKNAIGFNAARGDSVKIENIQFQKEDFTEAERLVTSLERQKILRQLLKWSLLGLSLMLFFFVVVRPFMRWITDSFQETVEDMLPRTIEELEELQSVDQTLPGMSGALPVLQESIDPDKAESELLKERIMNILEQDEEKAAGAFSLWLARRDT